MIYYRYLIYATYSFFARQTQVKQGPFGSTLLAISIFSSANLFLLFILLGECLTLGRVDLAPTLKPFFLSSILCWAVAAYCSLYIQGQLTDIVREFDVISPRGLNQRRAHLVVGLFYLFPIVFILANVLLHILLSAH
jgi:hypothetical protein